VRAELLHADGRSEGRTDGQTDTMKLIVFFRNFAKAPKIANFSKTSENAKFRDHKISGPTFVCTIFLKSHVITILQVKDSSCHPLA